MVTLYTLATWVAYVSLWYMEYLPQIRDSRGVRSVGLERAVKAFPVIIGPIVCVVRKISRAFSVAHRDRHLAFCSFGGSFRFGINERETQKVRLLTMFHYREAHVGLEKTVQLLMKERRTKVEEIKKKTNYYSTRDLLQRYDDSTPSNTPVIPRTLPGQNAPGQPSTPIRQPVPQHPNLGQTSAVNPRLARAPSPSFCTCPFLIP